MKPTAEPQSDDDRGDSSLTAAARREIREILDLLPADVVGELNSGSIDVNDTAFLAGLADHISRQALADPKNGSRLLGKLAKVKKLIRRSLHDSHVDVITSNTIRRGEGRIGRNDPCPCGSGRKFKECCRS